MWNEEREKSAAAAIYNNATIIFWVPFRYYFTESLQITCSIPVLEI
jgi:hypothetical protein